MRLVGLHKNSLFLLLIWLFEGILVGFGAILPGISGGTLCVAFGMYRPIIETISHLKAGIKKYGLMLFVFVLGGAVGFIGLSGLAAWLLEKDTALVTCAFIGFILGTLPELWQDAGAKGRHKGSYISMVLCFLLMLAVLALFKTKLSITIAPDLFGYLLCGVLWGLSFIVPGLSSSSLLLFFGLYQDMLKGISTFDFKVLIPMGIGALACVLLLSKAVEYAYKKQYSVVSHGVLGIVVATAIMIIPIGGFSSPASIAVNLAAILGGGVLSYLFTKGCDRLKENSNKR